ncbi:Tetraspanin-11 [Holothuria leucospilota]|uniref:Tetraspanin-11 n=1 Tax=Holothuria leucospilota TaxID=206669 RepID=A0A9Q0YMS4_HOLLE|nr:Tetraspanin-11 [Holothuria leucospilota]
MLAKSNEFLDLFSEDTLIIVAGMMVGIGCFAFLVGFCGCWGALRENSCLLYMYFVFLLLIVAGEFVAGVLALVYEDEIEQSMRTGMNETIATTYGYKTAATDAVDEVQEQFECCGANNYMDYQYSAYMIDQGTAIPASCCKTGSTCTAGSPGEPNSLDNVWTDGCVDASIDYIESNYLIVGGVCLGLLVFQVWHSLLNLPAVSPTKRGGGRGRTGTRAQIAKLFSPCLLTKR